MIYQGGTLRRRKDWYFVISQQSLEKIVFFIENTAMIYQKGVLRRRRDWYCVISQQKSRKDSIKARGGTNFTLSDNKYP